MRSSGLRRGTARGPPAGRSSGAWRCRGWPGRRPAVAGHGDGLGAVAGLGDDLQVRFAVEDEPDAAADQRVVVGEQDAGLLQSGAVTGCLPRGRARSGGPRCRRPAAGRSCSRAPIEQGPFAHAADPGALRGRAPMPAAVVARPAARPPSGSRRSASSTRVGARRGGRRWSGSPGRRGRAPARSRGPARAGRGRNGGCTVQAGVGGELGGQRGERTDQAEVVQHAGAQPARDAAHLVQAAAGGLLRLAQLGAQGLGRQVGGPLEFEQDRGQALADLVVQFLGDAAPLGLLRRQRAARCWRRAPSPAGRACALNVVISSATSPLPRDRQALPGTQQVDRGHQARSAARAGRARRAAGRRWRRGMTARPARRTHASGGHHRGGDGHRA